MSKYLVECTCGNKLSVEIGQAGGRITCSCGATVDVPTLRKLRQLPPAEAKEEQYATSASRWGARQGIMTASFIAIGALLIGIVYSWLTQPKRPDFDAVAYTQNTERVLEKLTPTDGWRMWVEYYRPLAERGFPLLEAGNRAQLEAQISRAKSLRRTLWGTLAVFAIVAAAAALWPRPQTPQHHPG